MMTSTGSSDLQSSVLRLVKWLRGWPIVIYLGLLVLLISSGASVLALHATASASIQGPSKQTPSLLEISFDRPAGGQLDVIPLPNSPRSMAPGPGLYGGTLNNTCDSGAMLALLQKDHVKAAAWARVQGIAVADIPTYIAGLRPVALRSSLAATSHGFANGQPTNIPIILRAGTAILVDKSGRPRTLCYCGNPLAPDSAVTALLDECKKHYIDVSDPVAPTGQLDYPKNLSLKLNQSINYTAAVDIRSNPLPPDQVIQGPTPDTVPVTVSCVLNARLVPPPDKSLDVDHTDWISRRFPSTGILKWSWEVTARKPGDHEIRIDLQPALTAGGNSYISASTSDDATDVAGYTTSVHVDANAIQQFGQSWDDDWPIILGVAGAVGTALLAFLAFTSKFRDALAKMSRKNGA